VNVLHYFEVHTRFHYAREIHKIKPCFLVHVARQRVLPWQPIYAPLVGFGLVITTQSRSCMWPRLTEYDTFVCIHSIVMQNSTGANIQSISNIWRCIGHHITGPGTSYLCTLYCILCSVRCWIKVLCLRLSYSAFDRLDSWSHHHMAVKQVTDGTAPFSDFVYSGDTALPLQPTDAYSICPEIRLHLWLADLMAEDHVQIPQPICHSFTSWWTRTMSNEWASSSVFLVFCHLRLLHESHLTPHCSWILCSIRFEEHSAWSESSARPRGGHRPKYGQVREEGRGEGWRTSLSLHRRRQISALTGLPAINDVIRYCRIAVFGDVARLQDSTTAHKAYTVLRQPPTRSSSPSLLESSAWSPTWQMDRPIPKRHRPDTCRSLETCPCTRSSRMSDATMKMMRSSINSGQLSPNINLLSHK